MAKKSLGLLLIIIILGGLNVFQLYYFTMIIPSVPQEDVPLDVIKLVEGDKGDKEKYIGRTITLDGYYVEGGSNISLLITNPIVFENNSLTPSNYLIISGNVPSSLQDNIGAQIHLKGRVAWSNATEELLEIEFNKYTLIQEGVLGHLSNSFMDVSKFDWNLSVVPHRNTKYAVLISGGIKPEKAYARYWNDITSMYFILTWLYDYDPDNIYVIYKDGVGENAWAPCYGLATHSTIETVFLELEGKMTAFDDLFIYTTNHGWTGGLCLWNPMDPYPLTPNELSTMLEDIEYKQMIIVMEQCKSGVFIDPLSAERRVILTACSPYQSSYGCDTEGAWDEFLYHFMCAVAQFKINGDSGLVNSDTNNDGRVSMYEAFMYASAHDSRLENPYYDDDGDGDGLPAILLAFLDPSQEGAFGMNTFL